MGDDESIVFQIMVVGCCLDHHHRHSHKGCWDRLLVYDWRCSWVKTNLSVLLLLDQFIEPFSTAFDRTFSKRNTKTSRKCCKPNRSICNQTNNKRQVTTRTWRWKKVSSWGCLKMSNIDDLIRRKRSESICFRPLAQFFLPVFPKRKISSKNTTISRTNTTRNGNHNNQESTT